MTVHVTHPSERAQCDIYVTESFDQHGDRKTTRHVWKRVGQNIRRDRIVLLESAVVESDGVTTSDDALPAAAHVDALKDELAERYADRERHPLDIHWTVDGVEDQHIAAEA